MRVKIDEDLPRPIIQSLRDRGHDTVGVVEQGMGGWKDNDLWQAIQAEQRFLVTADKGFANVRLYAPGTHIGILLLRPDQDRYPALDGTSGARPGELRPGSISQDRGSSHAPRHPYSKRVSKRFEPQDPARGSDKVTRV